MKRRLPWLILLFAAGLPAKASSAAPEPEPQATWEIRSQGQLPVIAANHAVGGFGVAVAAEKGLWALIAEGQILPIDVCDSSCGLAYSAGLGVALQPNLGRGVSAHFELMGRYYLQPTLNQYVPALAPRVGVRWPDQGTAVSLDAGVSFVAAHNFDGGGFANNKVLRWGIPEVVLGLWF